VTRREGGGKGVAEASKNARQRVDACVLVSACTCTKTRMRARGHHYREPRSALDRDMKYHDTTLQTRTRLERPSTERRKPVGGTQTRIHPHFDCPDLLGGAEFTLEKRVGQGGAKTGRNVRDDRPNEKVRHGLSRQIQSCPRESQTLRGQDTTHATTHDSTKTYHGPQSCHYMKQRNDARHIGLHQCAPRRCVIQGTSMVVYVEALDSLGAKFQDLQCLIRRSNSCRSLE
jgi:hypothetical protein